MPYMHRQTKTITFGEDEIDMEVEVVYSMARAEPDVGLMSDYVDDMYLEQDGERAHHIENGMSRSEWEDLVERVEEDHE